MVKNIKNMNLEDRFKSRGFSPMAYAKAHCNSNLTTYITTLNKILNGSSTGVKKSHNDETKVNGVTRRVIAQLKKDGVWIGRLPWEVERDGAWIGKCTWEVKNEQFRFSY